MAQVSLPQWYESLTNVLISGSIQIGFMPLILDKTIDEYTRVAVWDAQEGNAYFKRYMQLTQAEKAAYQEMKPHRQREWMTSRFLLHFISGEKERTPIHKTKFGKPFRYNCHKHISISHSKDKVAVIISDKSVGIDIQNEVEKIARIQHKFVSDNEAAKLPAENLIPYYHVFWGAKESMYKAHGTKELEFKEHMHVYPFRFFRNDLELKGWVRKGDFDKTYDLVVYKIESDYLVYCMECQ